MKENSLSEYRKYWKELNHFRNILGLLHWDMEVNLPEKASEERSEQISLLASQSHEMLVGKKLSDLISDLEVQLNTYSLPEKDILSVKREIEILKKDIDREKKLPLDLVKEFSRVTSLGQSVWANARKKSSFSDFAPVLSEIVKLSQQMADCYGYTTEKYDALLEGYEEGTRAESLKKLFAGLKNSIIPLVAEAGEFSSPFKKPVSAELQKTFNEKLPASLGLRSESSRLDISAHPFSTSLGRHDQRITTRYSETDPLSSIFGVLHETGHALYEHGLAGTEIYPSPAAQAVSYGMHESQSRLWENQVGRSRAFWEYYYPVMLKDYNIYHYDLPFDEFFRYVNSVSKSKIRVEADQVTYNLHIILRFEIERELINGNLSVSELPNVWDQKMKEYFSLEIENDAEGVLQDVHWSCGSFGYFPTYTLGNIYSAQLFHKFNSSNSGFWENLRTRGDVSLLNSWLGRNVYSHGRYFSPEDLIEKASGEKPDSSYLVKYLKSKILEQSE